MDKDYIMREIDVGFAPGYSFKVGDINGDGKCEYISVEPGGKHLVVLEGDGGVLWEKTVPNTDRHSTTALEVGDVDRDGEMEVVMGEEPEGGNNVIVLDPQGRLKRRLTFPLGEKDYAGNAIDSFGFADVDGDGFKELIVGINGGHLYALDDNLEILWHLGGLNRTIEHFIHTGDLNGDGVDEIAISSSPTKEWDEHCEFFLISGEGRILWRKPLSEIGPDGHVDYAIIDDIEGSGRNTLITATGGCLFDAEGNLIWTLRDEIAHGQWVDVAKVREDVSGKQVLISELWKFRQPCLLVSGQGEVLWRFEEISPYALPTHAYFIDWNGDGKKFVIIGDQPAYTEPVARTYQITLLDSYGNVVLKVPFEDEPIPGWFYNAENSPAVADVDGDGKEEFVFPIRKGKLLILGKSQYRLCESKRLKKGGISMLSSRWSENKWKLAHQFGTIYGVEEAQAMLEVLTDWAPTCGKRVKEFEQRFAVHEGARDAIATNSWVGAAHLVAILLDLQPGDEIVVPAITFHASANIFVREGAKIVFAESDPRTFNLDPKKLEEKITPKTRAVMPVHMCGQPCDMDPIMEIARKHDLVVIQDAAHAPGAEYHGKKLGEIGDFTIYSFQQSKNMSTLGEGGMVVTNNDEWAEKMRKLRSHGGGDYPGINSRMPDVQGAVGLVQLERLDRHNEIRRRLAYYLNELLADVKGIATPYEIPDIKHVYHLYNTVVDEKAIGMTRDEFIDALWEKEGIKAITQYHPTVNCLPAYKAMGHGEGECPVSEETASKIVTLPLSTRFTEADMEELVEGVKSVIGE